MSHRTPQSPHHKTRAGYGIPHEQAKGVENDVSPRNSERKTPVPQAPESIRPTVQSIEVQYVQERDVQSLRSTAWPVLEIWTRNRIYQVDALMICVAVINRETGEHERSHALKGTRLTGGERRSKSTQTVEIYHPFPMPGTEAVFRDEKKRGGGYAHTSTIERVVLRVRKVRIGKIDSSPSWDEITGRFQIK
jgi:hypothetical protein